MDPGRSHRLPLLDLVDHGELRRYGIRGGIPVSVERDVSLGIVDPASHFNDGLVDEIIDTGRIV